MPNKLTGPQLFLRYAFPCAEDKLRSKNITSGDFEWLKNTVDGNLEPNGWLLEYCFREASQDLKIFAKNRRGRKWSFENVAEYWRHNHGHEGDCAVTTAVVCEVNKDGAIVSSNNVKFFVLNRYNLNLQVGVSVYLHKRTVIEIVEV